jgi:NADH:ubiquinone oxidoreductase subunit K
MFVLTVFAAGEAAIGLAILVAHLFHRSRRHRGRRGVQPDEG